jgi:hypothetical protein
VTECICGVIVQPENWPNHLLASIPRGPHEEFHPVDGLSTEEARLLQRLDAVEADTEYLNTRSGKNLRTRIVNRLTDLAQRPEA